MAKRVAITELPPYESSGSGIPVMGMIPTFMPTLMKT